MEKIEISNTNISLSEIAKHVSRDVVAIELSDGQVPLARVVPISKTQTLTELGRALRALPSLADDAESLTSLARQSLEDSSFQGRALLVNHNTVQRRMSSGCPTLGGATMGDLVKWLGKLESAHHCSASRLNENRTVSSFTRRAEPRNELFSWWRSARCVLLSDWGCRGFITDS
jgi:hypothetical protein